MSLEGLRIWLVSRGEERSASYQHDLVRALEQLGAASVSVVGFDGTFRTVAADLTSRAGEWIEGAADWLSKGLKIRRLLGKTDEVLEGEPQVSETAADATTSQDAQSEETSGEDGPPDIAIIDNPTLIKPLNAIPAVRAATPLFIALVDDFKVNTRWREAGVGAVIVPHDALAQAHLAADGAALVKVAGPPTSARFIGQRTVQESREKLGLSAEKAVVIVAAEGMNVEDLDRVVFQLTLFDEQPTVVFHYGDSHGRAQLLREAAENYGLEAKIFGKVEGEADFFAAASVVVVGADDPVAIDLLMCRRPVVLVGSERGAARAVFLSDVKAVLHVPDIVELGAHLETILESDVGKTLVEQAKTIVAEDSTTQVAVATGDLFKEWVERLKKESKETLPVPVTEKKTEPPRAPDVFESIGAQPKPDAEQLSSPQSALPPISVAEAKDQMASLILREREAERALAEYVQARDRWLERRDLAMECGDKDLLGIAADNLNSARRQVAQLNAQIETIRRSKAKLKARFERQKRPRLPKSPASKPQVARESENVSDVEERFRKMELERDLRRLRQKLDDDEY